MEFADSTFQRIGSHPPQSGKADGGRLIEVRSPTPSTKVKQRRTPRNFGKGTHPHVHVRTPTRKRAAMIHQRLDSTWGAWHEEERTALHHRNWVKEHHVPATQSRGGMKPPTPIQRKTRSNSGVTGRILDAVGTL